MQATFKMSFNEELELVMTWKETGQTGIVPSNFPINGPQDVKKVARALFPQYDMQVMTWRRKQQQRKIWLDKYFLKLVPEVEKFKFPSFSQSGKFYEITVVDRGRGRRIHCSCWPYIKTGVRCDHIYGWLKLKEHPVAEELAVYDGPSKCLIPSLTLAINRTLRTGDTNREHEKKFTASVRRKLRCQQQSRYGLMMRERLLMNLGSGATQPKS